MVATTMYGLEDILEKELIELGAENVQKGKRETENKKPEQEPRREEAGKSCLVVACGLWLWFVVVVVVDLSSHKEMPGLHVMFSPPVCTHLACSTCASLRRSSRAIIPSHGDGCLPPAVVQSPTKQKSGANTKHTRMHTNMQTSKQTHKQIKTGWKCRSLISK